MAGKDTKVTVTLALLDQTQAALAQAQANFTKLKDVAGDGGNTLNAYRRSTEEASGATEGFTKSLGGLNNMLGTVASSSGLGKFANLLGIGGPLAAVAAGTALMAQSIRMGYEMERAATNVATRLTIGAGSISVVTAQLIRSAEAVSRNTGFTNKELIEAGGAYAASSGTNRISSADMATFAAYSKGFGIDINAVAGALGTIKQYAGGNAQRNASLLFGGMDNAGDFGRRHESYIPLITQTIAQMQTSGNMFSLESTQRMVNSVARLGGYFGTDKGAAEGVGALESLGRRSENLYTNASKLAAGVSIGDIMTGNTNNGRDINLLLSYAQRVGGRATNDRNGSANNIKLLNNLQNLVGPEAGTDLYNMAVRNGGNLVGLNSGAVALELDPKKKAAAALSTPSGDIDKDIANLKTVMEKVGDHALPAVEHALDKLTETVIANEGKLVGLGDDLTKAESWLEKNTWALYILAGVMAANSVGSVASKFGFLGKLFGRGAGAAGEAAEGAGGLAEGAAEGFLADAGGTALAGAGVLGGAISGVVLGGLVAPWAYIAHEQSMIPRVEDVRMADSIVAAHPSIDHETALKMAQSRRKISESMAGPGSGAAGSDLADPSMSSWSLIDILGTEQSRGFNPKIGWVKTGHHNDGWMGHYGGHAADVNSVDGQDIDSYRGKQFILDLARNPLVRQLGLDPWIRSQPGTMAQIRDAWAASGHAAGDMFPDEAGHVHVGSYADSDDLQVHVTVTKKKNTVRPGTRRPHRGPGMGTTLAHS